MCPERHDTVLQDQEKDKIRRRARYRVNFYTAPWPAHTQDKMNSAHAEKKTRYRVPKPRYRGQLTQKTKQIWHMSIGTRYRVDPTRYRARRSRMPINREFHAICKVCLDN